MIASSERQMFQFNFADDTLMSQLTNFLVKRLSFEDITTNLSVEDVSFHNANKIQNFDKKCANNECHKFAQKNSLKEYFFRVKN